METQQNFRHTLNYPPDRPAKPAGSPRQNFRLALTLTLAFLLLALLALPALFTSTPATATGLPTPIANLPGTSPDAVIATFLDNDTRTADAAGPAVQIYTAEYCYMQYLIDQTTGNSTTMTVQYSMDATNWVNGLNLVSANTTDTTGLAFVPVYARYIRIYEDHTNTNALTTTVLALCK